MMMMLMLTTGDGEEPKALKLFYSLTGSLLVLKVFVFIVYGRCVCVCASVCVFLGTGLELDLFRVRQTSLSPMMFVYYLLYHLFMYLLASI